MPRLKYHEFERFAEHTLEKFRQEQPERLAVDTETTGFTWKDVPFGVSVAWHRDTAPWDDEPLPWTPRAYRTGWFETLDEPRCKEMATVMLQEHVDRGGTFVYFNAKFDARMLDNDGTLPYDQGYPYEDAAPMVALLQNRGGRKLKQAARIYLGVSTNEEEALKKVRAELKLSKDDGYYPIPRDIVVPYALKDALWTLQLFELLEPILRDEGLWNIYRQKDIPLIHRVLRMEQAGVAVLPDEARVETRNADETLAVERTWIEQELGMPVGKGDKKRLVEVGKYKNGNIKYKSEKIPEFNPESPDQLKAVLNGRGHKLTSTRKAILQRIANDPLVAHILTLRGESKLRSGYFMPILKESVWDEDLGKWILHPNFNPWATETGRFSSSEVGEA